MVEGVKKCQKIALRQLKTTPFQIIEKLEERGNTKVLWMLQPKIYEALLYNF
jgi:hypothetical protein